MDTNHGSSQVQENAAIEAVSPVISFLTVENQKLMISIEPSVRFDNPDEIFFPTK
jgi:hypothetical protein